VEYAVDSEVDRAFAITEVDVGVEVDGFGEEGLVCSKYGAGDDEAGIVDRVVEGRLFIVV
jgi:hypothetical protein